MKKYMLYVTACLALSGGAEAQLGGLVKKAKEKVSGSSGKTENAGKPETPAAAKPTEPPPAAQEQKPEAAPAKTVSAERNLMWPEGSSYRVNSDAPATPLHEKYLGRLVFSSQQLTPENTKETAFKSSFNIDEPIYGRVYIASAVKNYILYSGNGTGSNGWENNYGECSLKYTVDDKDTVYVLKNYTRRDDTRSWTTWQYFICARGENAEFNNDRFIAHMNLLSNGEHTIKLKLWGGGVGDRWSMAPIATGEFTINKLPGKKMSLGRNWGLYKAGMSNPALEKEMVEVMKQKAARDGWKETFSKAKILDKDWYVARNDYTGEKLYRTINATVYAKWPDGHCTAQEFGFKQQWTGAAWSKILEFNGVGNQTVIDCD